MGFFFNFCSIIKTIRNNARLKKIFLCCLLCILTNIIESLELKLWLVFKLCSFAHFYRHHFWKLFINTFLWLILSSQQYSLFITLCACDQIYSTLNFSKNCLYIYIYIYIYRPDAWGCKIRRLHLCIGVKPPKWVSRICR